ncbi:MAG: hypothetical protein MZW92_10010 [Comamonadaceae bacterium]|nr:hypothetical protein [Comamonadaceae bacterium]
MDRAAGVIGAQIKGDLEGRWPAGRRCGRWSALYAGFEKTGPWPKASRRSRRFDPGDPPEKFPEPRREARRAGPPDHRGQAGVARRPA